MSKAYDRIEWCFLRDTMTRMGFSAPWIDKVMNCVSTASFSMLING